jgi:hypothetical protein
MINIYSREQGGIVVSLATASMQCGGNGEGVHFSSYT